MWTLFLLYIKTLIYFTAYQNFRDRDVMALNIVWIAFIVIAFMIALIKCIFLNDTTIFKTLVDGIFDSAKSSVLDVAFPLAGTMIFFLGLMNIAEKAGAINWLQEN